MGNTDHESLAAISQRLEALADARLQKHLSNADQEEYRRLVKVEAALIKVRNAGPSAPRER